MPEPVRRIAICGGTFDPFHRGHLEPVLAARDQMGWDRVLYVPAHRQPFKLEQDTASGHHRFAMAVLATADHDDVWVTSWELERDRTSYSVDTLEHLRAEFPVASLDWLIGDDNLADLEAWKSLDRIFELANFVVLTRGGANAPVALASRIAAAGSQPPHGAIVFAHTAAVPVSSTEIRRRVAENLPIEALVDPRVSRYIHHYGLYRPSTKGVL